MIMNNMESDTDEVFIRGQTYKKISNDLKRGLTLGRDAKKDANVNKAKVDVAPFQNMLHAKAQFVQDNTDEFEEPRKPD